MTKLACFWDSSQFCLRRPFWVKSRTWLLAVLGVWSSAMILPLSAESQLFMTATPRGGSLLSLAWPTVVGRAYELQSTVNLGSGWIPSSGVSFPVLATTTVQTQDIAAADVRGFFQIKENPSPYDPAWSAIAPIRTIPFTYDEAKTAEQNGASLKSAIQALVPGDRLEIGGGTYSIDSYTTFNLQGTDVAPIWIVAAPDQVVTITRPDANQNIINVGAGAPTRFVCFAGIEFRGGSHGIRLYDCGSVWVDRCKIHETADVGISANAADTSHLYITRNEIWNTGRNGGTGEGMYLGGNNGSVIMSESIIALNHVHDTVNGPSQGDGIEVKQGSWGNLIAANRVHDCNYPCILVYGTAGMPRNIVEHNVCYRSNDNAMQIQGECTVRNNLVISATGSAFASQYHQGAPTELTVAHNTFINSGTAVRLSAWDSGANMIFANNACYSENGAALNAVTSVNGVVFAGNVSHGSVTSGASGFRAGTGLGDFFNVSWDATEMDARPGENSPLLGAADDNYATATDVYFYSRKSPHTAGCFGP